MKILGAIIAGGTSSRMGGNEKAFLRLAGKNILDLVIGRFDQQVDGLVINANGDASRFTETGLAVVPDIITTLTTPLAGLHAVLGFAGGAECIVTVPADTPFLPLDLANKLLERAETHGAAIARSAGRDHYIVGAWKTSLLPELERAITRDGLFRVKDWVRQVSAHVVTWPHIPYDPFFNVNTPEDLRAAQDIVRGQS
jgi:molybdopterin-guanine dinucleotide biosynthesis protein A